MIDKTTQAAGVADMLAKIRAYQSQMQNRAGAPEMPAMPSMPGMPGVAPLEDTNRIGKPSFAEVVRTSIESVNDLQSKSAQLREAYEKGENVPLTDVVLGMQKASLSFEATLQIRNKVLKAYEDILNMPV
ncbi:MAG: flagellar hook-basal body complex protein FliE [Betaproteobacteria bacterium]|nr:flagellar hook-basal body complex protein FliE [Betaproteobacteria bacterium]NBT75970.1 flagellar hook-basal body complex protein FliE [Betaproteobacteria bacterium]NBY14431.1 flagellar hook-basal body complex protein FliE [Betaproteobacteria bacterium]NCA17410.1 flagellar hook-basal body complex protein FliE [Betaproteobacteria bacterium]